MNELFFLIRESDSGNTRYHGQVLREVGPGYFLCRLYSWLDGMPSDMIVAHIATMVEWRFFDTVEDWRAAAAR